MDPAFKRDAFGFTIVHKDEEGNIVVDLVRRWISHTRSSISPSVVLDEIKQLLDQYDINFVYSDQYHLESLQELALQRNFSLIGLPFTAKNTAQLFGNLQQLFFQKRIKLIDNPELIRELKQLERTLTGQGNVHISAPMGQYDDLATTLCLAACQAVQSPR